MCDVDFIDPAEVWQDTLVRSARKEHRCHCCGGRILVGQSYVRHFDLSNGRPNRENACMECDAMTERFKALHSSYYSPSGMPELIQQCREEAEYEGDSAMAAKWQAELDAMVARKMVE